MKKNILIFVIFILFTQSAYSLVAVRVFGNSDWSQKSLDSMAFCFGDSAYFVPTAGCKYIPPGQTSYYSYTMNNYGCAVAVDAEFNCVTSCPSDAPLDPNTLQCTPPVSCPPAGQKTYLEECSSEGQIPQIDVDGSGEVTDSQGCKSKLMPDDAAVWPEGEIRTENGVKKSCLTSQYTSTGESGPIPDTSPESNDSMSSGNEDPIKSTQEYDKQITPTETTNNADGSETKVDETEETINKPTHESDTETEYVRRDGDLIEKTTKTTTTTNSDGSIEQKTEITYKETDGVEVKIDKTNGRVTETPAKTKTSGTTTTETKDATGKVTGGGSSSFGGAGTDNGGVKDGNKGTSGTDNDPGDGDDKEDEEGEECTKCGFDGEAPSEEGLYTPTEKTYEDVLNSFKNDVMTDGPIAAASDFFTVSLPSGSCPIWSATIPYINFDFVVDQQCSPVMTSIWPFIQAVLLLVAGFLAFRWAFL